ncbi:MAG TPA: NAD(P)-dependent oxidoreductase [Terriglobales bacterium]|jgi:phosphoglycerate dehydrogenase-like enzyme|nr:NAD(P)-dependent oxidoreductase [Terriglobales bacterium]
MRPRLLISAGNDLFRSFFSADHQNRLSRTFDWQTDGARQTTAGFRQMLARSEALITTWDSPEFDRGLTQLAPKLRMVAHCGGEVKRRFASPLFTRLTITNAPKPMAQATAELGAAFLTYCARDVDRYREALRKPSSKIYSEAHTLGTDESLYGREVGMIGFGRVGRALVDLMRGFELSWVVYDPYAPRELSRDYPVVFTKLEPLLRRSHLLVLTAALTDRTRGLLDQKALARLPDGAVVINIARGGLVDLPALTKEVRRRRLRCALDVTDPAEPLPIRHPLRKLPGAILTPHVAGGGRHVRGEIASTVIEDLERFFRGQAVKNRVTAAMLKRMT